MGGQSFRDRVRARPWAGGVWMAAALVAASLQTADARSETDCVRVDIGTNETTMVIERWIVDALYDRAGLCVEIVSVPLLRGNFMLEDGLVDALSLRTDDYRMPATAMALPTPVSEGAGRVVSLREDGLVIESAEDLAGLRIGVRTGTAWAEGFARRAGAEILAFPDYEDMLFLVELDRIDAFLIDNFTLQRLTVLNIIDPGLIAVSPPLTRQWLYHVVGPRLIEHVPALDAALRDLQADGTLAAAVVDYFQSLTVPQLRFSFSSSVGWTPFVVSVDGGGPPSGLLPDLVDRIMSDAGISIVYVDVGARDMDEMFDRNLVDFEVVSPAWFPDGRVPGGSVLSDPIDHVADHVFSHTPALLYGLTSADLEDVRVGMVATYRYDRIDHMQRVDYPSEALLVRALARREVDYAIINRRTAAHWSAETGVTVHQGPEHSSGPLQLRLRATLARFLPRINASIRASIHTLNASRPAD